MPLKMFREDDQIGPLDKVGNIVAVAAGKGGVGKSTVSVNLALAFRQMGYRVGIFDADIYGPSVRQMLPEDRLPTKKDQKLLPAMCAGIRVMTMAYFRGETEGALVRAPIANRVISQFMQEVDWGELDLLFVDFPPGTGDIQLTLSQQARLNAAVMVTTPSKVSTLDVNKAMGLFAQVQVPVLGVIENMAYYQTDSQEEPLYPFGRGGGEELARNSGVPFLGSIPIDSKLCQCADKGESLFLKYPNLPVTHQFLNLAQILKQHLKALAQTKGDHLESFELIWEKTNA